MKAPSRYSARISAVNASFLRISGTWKALRIVATTARCSDSLLDDLADAAGGLDALARGGGEPVRVHGQLLGQLPPPEDLDGDVLALGQPGGAQRGEVHRGAVVEPRLEVGEVDRLRVRAERLEGHRHLLVRAAQLAHPHVD